MVSAYTDGFVLDVPLKRPQETFVDDPNLLDEVLLAELEFDLAHGVKDINRLHVYHAIAVLQAMLHDLIALSRLPERFREFRAQQLANYGLRENGEVVGLGEENRLLGAIYGRSSNYESLRRGLETSNGEESKEEDRKLDENSPKVKNTDILLSPQQEAALSYDQLVEAENGKSDLNEAFGVVQAPGAPASPELCLSIKSDRLSPNLDLVEFISAELLVQTTSLEELSNPITTHSPVRLQREILFHSDPKTKVQEEHLLRCFNLAKAPPISVKEFLLRIKKYSPSVSVSVYIHSAYLLFKLSVLLDVVDFTELNVYRFILALIRALTKKCEDIYQKQKSFAMVGGMALRDLGKIEVSFLYLCNFKLVVSEFILNDFLKSNFVQLREFCKENLDPESILDDLTEAGSEPPQSETTEDT